MSHPQQKQPPSKPPEYIFEYVYSGGNDYCDLCPHEITPASFYVTVGTTDKTMIKAHEECLKAQAWSSIYFLNHFEPQQPVIN